jgi:hypothetical protein
MEYDDWNKINGGFIEQQCRFFYGDEYFTVDIEGLKKNLFEAEEVCGYPINSIMNNERIALRVYDLIEENWKMERSLKEYKKIVDYWNENNWSNINDVVSQLVVLGINSYKDIQDRFWENEDLDRIKEVLGDKSYIKLKRRLLKDLREYRRGDLHEPIIKFERNRHGYSFTPVNSVNSLVSFDRIRSVMHIESHGSKNDYINITIEISEKLTERFFNELQQMIYAFNTSGYRIDYPNNVVRIKWLNRDEKEYVNIEKNCDYELVHSLNKIILCHDKRGLLRYIIW